MGFQVGFTATREGLSEHQAAAVVRILADPLVTRVHHGDCIGGDAQIHMIARSAKRKIAIHPPIDDSQRAHCSLGPEGGYVHPPREYIQRNHDIVHASDRMVACPSSKVEAFRGSGTWATIRYARSIGKPLEIIYPDGESGS